MEENLNTDDDDNKKKKCREEMKDVTSPVAGAAKQLCHTILKYKGNEQSEPK